MAEFIRVIETLRTTRLQRQESAEQMAAKQSGRMVRLYCTQHASTWNLQIRGPLGIGPSGMSDGKDFIVATATLSRDDMIEIRDAINAALLDR